ncbi:MAG: sigma-70 family RNA polymerase sigma factor [Acidobacteriota bacterium]|nr:sigma-70 family RNA polymerase sigma factor [Acidobacteriota bacterium]
MASAVPVDQLPDEALLAGFASGDRELSLAFVRRFQSKVHGVALAVTNDPALADDIAQQGFVQAWRHGATYDARRASVGTWLSAITRNLAIDALRVRRPQPVDTDAILARVGSTERTPEAAALAGESIEELRAALRGLPPEQARAVVLAGVVGLSASQVAAAEGIPLGTAKTRIRTAMMALRRTLLTRQ